MVLTILINEEQATNVIPNPTTPRPSYYSEAEAAQRLGVSVERLRVLVQQHIIAGDPGSKTHVSSFSPTDLVLLRFVAGSSAGCPSDVY